jgi:hypothetical protein
MCYNTCRSLPYINSRAAVVELVDTPDSKSCGGNPVTVQVRPAAPKKKTQSQDWVFFFASPGRACTGTAKRRCSQPARPQESYSEDECSCAFARPAFLFLFVGLKYACRQSFERFAWVL